jgi:uncharacterized membrane protein YhaH (DUF805 family)
MKSQKWYFARDGAQSGPFEAQEIARMLRAGEIGAQPLVWHNGLEDWEPAKLHFDQPGTPPPVPPRIPEVARSGGPWRDRAPAGPDVDTRTGPDGLYIHAPTRGFAEAVSVCLRKYFTFSGRASRSEYWYFILFTVLLGFVTAFLDAAFFGVSAVGDDVGPLNTITTLAVFIPSLAVAWRRLHDIDRSGWWIGGFWLALLGGGLMMGAVMGLGGTDAAGIFVMLTGIGFLVYFAVMLVFMCTRGTAGPNRFG